MKKISLLIACFILSISTFSQTDASSAYFVVPPAYQGTQAGASFLGPLSNAQRTYQMLIRDSILTSMIGNNITGLTFRLLASATSNWPASDVTFTNYDIYLSESVAPENRSMTFAQNVVGVQKRVRFGTLTITAGSFPSGGSPTTFGADITFDSAYTYNGGHLLIEIRHTGFTGTSASVDAASTSSAGYGFLYSAIWAGSYTATSTTTQGNFVVTRLTGSPIVPVNNEGQIVTNFSLKQNYPNPFNPVTNISFSLPERSIVTLKIFDASGSEVERLMNNEETAAGTTSLIFNAEKLSSGVYFYSIYVNGALMDSKRMILIK